MTTALLDGDLLIHESAAAAQRKFDFGGDVVVHADDGLALANLEARLETIRLAAEADELIVALSCPTRRYWRHELMPAYKAGRGSAPLALSGLRAHVEANYRCYVRPKLEADDILGILATSPDLVPGRKVVVTTDKDLKQIPGLHLNHSKLAKGVVEITLEQGDRWHLFQTLTGDQTDGYSGCPGIGPVKAERILNAEGRAWDNIVSAFVRAGKTADDALLQARVARILRVEDWDFEKKEPRLWLPT